MQEAQRKYHEYREISSSLHVWIRDNTTLMQDRTFPNTLIELKKLAAESNRFRTEEVPRRLREKQHITRLYKDIEVNRKLSVKVATPVTVSVEWACHNVVSAASIQPVVYIAIMTSIIVSAI